MRLFRIRILKIVCELHTSILFILSLCFLPDHVHVHFHLEKKNERKYEQTFWIKTVRYSYEWNENAKNPSVSRCLHTTHFYMLDEFSFKAWVARLFIHCYVWGSERVCKCETIVQYNEIRCVTRKRGEKVKPRWKC